MKVASTIALVCIPFFLFSQSINFSQQRGFYSSPFSLTLTGETGQQIRYTTNGTDPTSTTGSVYSGPINITTTSVIRAIGVTAGTATPVQTHSYIFLNDVIHQPATIAGWPNNTYALGAGPATAVHDYAMDQSVVNNPAYAADLLKGLKEIPSISLVLDKNSFQTMYDGNIEVPASAEILYANNPVQNEQLEVGVEAHSHLRLKRSMRLTFDNANGGTGVQSNIFKNAPLNANSATNHFIKGKVVLRGGNNRSWARNWNPDRTEYTRDEWYRSSQIAMSGTGSHGTFVHLYVNGLYWGLYNPAERPDAGFQAKYFGGNYEDWLSFDSDGIRSGDGTRFNYLSGTLVKKDMTIAANYQEMQSYLDVENFIDYLILTWMMGMTDWPTNNFQGGNRNSPFVTPNKYFAWDGEWSWDVSNGSNNGAWVHPDFKSSQTTGTSLLALLWHSLRKNQDFMNLFADRVNKNCFNNGALTDDASISRWNTLNNFISNAIIAESARWGDALGDGVTRTKNQHWQPEVTRVAGLMQGNVQRFINALQAEGYYPALLAPGFSREGGITTSGTSLTITNPNSKGNIYYTLNGSDPRQANGSISADAVKYTGPIQISGDYTNVRARIYDGTDWSALHEGVFFYPQLKINEFLASNSGGITDESGVHEDWIEIYNKGTQPVNIAGMYITDLLSNPTLFQIPSTDASKTTIPPNGHLILWADNQPAEGPLHVNVKLSAGGEAIGISMMVDGVPTYLDQLSFGAQAADVSTGSFPDGSSLVRTFTTPTPGAPNVLPQLSGIYINEVEAVNTIGITDDAGEHDSWIEIYNKNQNPVNIGGLYVTNDLSDPLKYQLPSNAPALTTIPANGFIILWADNQTAQGALHLGFTLNASGGSIGLVNNDGITPVVLDQLSYKAQTANSSIGRYPDGAVNLKSFKIPTPSVFNTLPLISGLFINEWLASNNSSNTDESGEFEDWIEIYNSNSQPVDIGGLFITDNLANASKWQIPSDRPDLTVIPPGGFKLLYADEQPAQGVLHVNIKLGAGGEQIGLSQIQGGVSTLIDGITFGPQTTDKSEGRNPDGGNSIQALVQLTPGKSNQVVVNPLPVANAGPDVEITLPVSSARLVGTGTDNGSIRSYTWTQVGTTPGVAVFSSKTVRVPTVSGLKAGKYTFSLVVTDNMNAPSAADLVTVTVNPDPPPVANAGKDVVIALPASSTRLIGSGKDINGSIKSYAWTQVGTKPGVAIFSSKTTAVTIVSGLAEGVYTFSLIVTDQNNNRSIADRVTVTVVNNPAPVANAGPDKVITLPVNTVTLNGTGKDDGTIKSYAWIQNGTTPSVATFSSKTVAAPTVSNLIEGVYTFRLTVGDNFNARSQSDFVTVTVKAAPISGIPLMRINSGGPAISIGGVSWLADQYFAGGNGYSVTDTISGTTQDLMYQTERFGNFSYAIPVPNGNYLLRLHFAEIFFDAPGERVFSVNIESGQSSISGYDINMAAGGAYRAVFEEKTVTVKDGILNINFIPGVQNPKVSGIEIFTIPGSASVADGSLSSAGVLPADISSGQRSLKTNPSNSLTPWKVTGMPNPTTAYFNLKISGGSKDPVTISVFNSMGMQIEKIERSVAGDGVIQIGHNYRPGIYVIQVKQNASVKILKLIKQ